MSDKQNIDTPHETRPFRDHGHMDVITFGDFTVGRGVFEWDPLESTCRHASLSIL